MVGEIFDITVRPFSYDLPKIPVDERIIRIESQLLIKFIVDLFLSVNAELL